MNWSRIRLFVLGGILVGLFYVMDLDSAVRVALSLALLIAALILAVLYDSFHKVNEATKDIDWLSARLKDNEEAVKKLQDWREPTGKMLLDHEERISEIEEDVFPNTQ